MLLINSFVPSFTHEEYRALLSLLHSTQIKNADSQSTHIVNHASTRKVGKKVQEAATLEGTSYVFF